MSADTFVSVSFVFVFVVVGAPWTKTAVKAANTNTKRERERERGWLMVMGGRAPGSESRREENRGGCVERPAFYTRVMSRRGA